MSLPPTPAAPVSGARSRRADYPVSLQFLDRWSPRSFSEAPISEPDLMALLEAARWAPSASNVQPWRFAYSLRGDAFWRGYVGMLSENNQKWAGSAAALVVILSSRYVVAPNGDASISKTNSFDAGCAWGYLALQAHLAGWAAHAMAGFDPERARGLLAVPPAFAVEAVVAIGRQGPVDALPIGLRARELPSQRRPLTDSVFAGKFTG